MLNLYTLFCNLLPVRQNKVVLYAVAERYGDNMRYVAEELLRRNKSEIVWVSPKNKVPTPNGIRSVCGTIAMQRELATAHVIVTDGRLTKFWAKGLIKKPDQVYIHARYGSFELAKEEVDKHNATLRTLREAGQDSERLDFLVSNCTWHTNFYRCNYLFAHEYLQYGNPRNDLLFTSDRSKGIRTVKRKYDIGENIRIALYAPARRPWAGAQFHRLDYEKIQEALKERFGGEWVLLIRRHPCLSAKEMRWILPERMLTVVDAWDYPDTAELLAAADVMIGDYSGCTFDFLLTGRPTFLYMPDVGEYEKHIGFYEAPEFAPVPQATTNEALIVSITNFDIATFSETIRAYLERCGNVDNGHATSRLCDCIMTQLRTPLASLASSRRQVLKDAIYHREKITAKRWGVYLWGSKVRDYEPNPYKDAPVQKNKILFRTNNRMSYNCNAKYIAQEIIRRKLPYDLVWLVNPYILNYIKKGHIPPQIRLVVMNTQEAIYEYATAKVWVENNNHNPYLMRGFHKKKGQFFINTWHASIDLKQVVKKPGFTMRQWNEYRRYSKCVDYFISGAKWETKLREKMFHAKGKVLQIGHPRNDILITGDHESIRKRVFKAVGICDHKRVLLYSPTWRAGNHVDSYLTDYGTIIQACAARFGEEWTIATRLHPFCLSLTKAKDIRSVSCVDVSEYPDMQELLIAADAMITDYSSCVMDYLLLRKPAFLYAPDRTRYEKMEGLLYPLEETPFPVAQDLQTLLSNIKNFDYVTYLQRCEAFCRKKGYEEDGKASSRAVDFIETLIS